jgi:tripartite-type tricarboxylate transporter receptor subunit TctC
LRVERLAGGFDNRQTTGNTTRAMIRLRTTLTIHALTALGLLAVLAGGVRAQEGYPQRPVHIVVSYGAGGAIDVVTRIVAEHMATTLGKPMVVENKPGAGSTIAADAVARAAPDGYTLLVTGTAHAVMTALYPQTTIDPVRDFQPISHLGNMPFVLAVHPSLPVRDYAGFIAHLKAHPNTVNFGSAGPGSSSDLGALLLAQMAGVQFVRVPYRSTPAAMNALVAGEIGFMLDSQNVLGPQVQTGAVRGLATSTLERSRQLPELRTLDELGLRGYDASSWQAMLAPARTPRPIIDRITEAVRAALADPGVQKRYLDLGYQLPARIGPEAATEFLARETAKWSPLAKDSGASGG